MKELKPRLCASINIPFTCDQCDAKNHHFEDVAFNLGKTFSIFKIIILKCDKCGNAKEHSINLQYEIPKQ